MTEDEAIDRMFLDTPQLGPGSDAQTRKVLSLLRRTDFSTVLDVGCGSGRQTRVLAAELDAVIDAVELRQPFLDELKERATQAGVAERIRPHQLDMAALATRFSNVDLLWSEGAAYSIGFANALETWHDVMAHGGLLALSELTWLSAEPPEIARAFFEEGYPDMRDIAGNIEHCERAGYRVLTTHELPAECWGAGFYDVLGPRARELAQDADPVLSAYAASMLEEIDVFERAEGSFGYVFYVLERP